MTNYILEIELLSAALVGSGVGFGSSIDTDIVFDDLGLPHIPAKRIKGCLRDAAEEVREVFEGASITTGEIQIKETFGGIGAKDSAPVYFSNLYLEDFEQARGWLRYFVKSDKYKQFITPDHILDTFTEIRQQTKIGDDGVAFDHSLRTIRMLRKGLIFRGDLRMKANDEQVLNTMLFACKNFRRFGTKRNRGFGEVRCTLCDKDGQPLAINQKLEDLCTA